MRKILITLFLIGVLFISGCVQQTPKKEYVCPDGSTVSDASMCSQTTTTIKTEKCREVQECDEVEYQYTDSITLVTGVPNEYGLYTYISFDYKINNLEDKSGIFYYTISFKRGNLGDSYRIYEDQKSIVVGAHSSQTAYVKSKYDLYERELPTDIRVDVIPPTKEVCRTVTKCD